MVLATLCLVGCSESAKPSKATPKVIFEGLTLPGSHADAKASGFTNCRAGSSSYECRLSGERLLFGIKPVSATVFLDGNNNLVEGIRSSPSGDVRSRTLEQLSYRDIRIELPKDGFDEKCVKNKDGKSYDPPMECMKQPGVRAFMEKLKAAGWVETSWKSYRTFFLAGVPIAVSVQPYKGEVTISPESLETVSERLRTIASREAAEREKQAQANSVINAMKAPK